MKAIIEGKIAPKATESTKVWKPSTTPVKAQGLGKATVQARQAPKGEVGARRVVPQPLSGKK